jgi:acyl carrier protein
MNREDVFLTLKDILVREFDIEPALITAEAALAEDLDLDSIDAVDLIVKMKEHTTDRIDPALFKNVKTVRDVVDILLPLVKVP